MPANNDGHWWMEPSKIADGLSMSLPAIAILPLDRASVVYERPVFDEVVLKHVDGEYVRVRRTGDRYSIGRIHEGAVTWHEETVSTFDQALFRATDMQAFGFRVGGRAETLVTRGISGEDTSVVELEPLDLGGVIVDDYSHLPLTIRYIDNTLWRVRIESTAGESEVVVEKKSPSAVQWESVDRGQGVFQPAHAVELLLEVGPDIVSVDAPVNGDLQKEIQKYEDELEFASVEMIQKEADLADMTGTQTRTVDF